MYNLWYFVAFYAVLLQKVKLFAMYAVFQKIGLLQFTRYCVEKILAKISDRGEKITNFRYAYDWYTLCILGVCHLRLPCKKPATLFHFFWFTDLSFFPSCWSSTQTNAMLWIETSTHRSHFENWFPFSFFCALLNSHGFCFFSFDFCGGRGPG